MTPSRRAVYLELAGDRIHLAEEQGAFLLATIERFGCEARDIRAWRRSRRRESSIRQATLLLDAGLTLATKLG